MDKVISEPQCQTPGCARQLLQALRDSGCVVWGQTDARQQIRANNFPTLLMIDAEQPDSSALLVQLGTMLERHWQRMLMLLWAEHGGCN